MASDEPSKFTGEGEAVPLVESAKGGAAILTGIGIDTTNMAVRAAAGVARGPALHG